MSGRGCTAPPFLAYSTSGGSTVHLVPTTAPAVQVPAGQGTALEASKLSDILMQPLELFPISSCNSWALPGLPTLPSLQKMSIGHAGTGHVLHAAHA